MLNQLAKYFCYYALSYLLIANRVFADETNKRLQQDQQTIKLKKEEASSFCRPAKLCGEVDFLSSLCNQVGLILSSTALPSTIKDVLIASPAYHANIEKDDKLLSVNLKDNKLCTLIERRGKQYYTEIPISGVSPSGNNSSNELGVIGIQYYADTKAITFVDPNSDLFGKVKIGDVYVSANNGPVGIQNSSGSTGTTVRVAFIQNGRLRDYLCRRKPINSFNLLRKRDFELEFSQVH